MNPTNKLKNFETDLLDDAVTMATFLPPSVPDSIHHYATVGHLLRLGIYFVHNDARNVKTPVGHHLIDYYDMCH